MSEPRWSAQADGLDRTATTAVAPGASDDLSVDRSAAYRIQRQLVDRRVRRGARVTGYRLGVLAPRGQTAGSRSERAFTATLTSDMDIPAGATLETASFISPHVTPAIAFVLRRPVGAGADIDAVLAATDRVCAAIEVADSHSEQGPDIVGAIAANDWSAGVVLGTDLVLPPANLALVGCNVELDGTVVDSASGAAVMDHPAAAVAFIANELAAYRGEKLEEGQIVLSGSLTTPIRMTPGQTLTVTVASIGRITLPARLEVRSPGLWLACKELLRLVLTELGYASGAGLSKVLSFSSRLLFVTIFSFEF